MRTRTASNARIARIREQNAHAHLTATQQEQMAIITALFDPAAPIEHIAHMMR